MLKRIILRICDYLFVMRPLILIPAWSFYLLGSVVARRAAEGSSAAGLDVGLGCLTAIMACAYLVNQLFDQESDRYNNKCRYIADGIFKARSIILLAFVCFLVASTLLREVTPAQRTPLIAAMVLALAYSLPPLRLCARPFADLGANAVGYGGVAFVSGYGAVAPVGWETWMFALPYICLVGATFLHTTILDVRGDRASGKRSTTVVIGVPASLTLASLLTVAAFALAWLGPFRSDGDWTAPLVTGAALAMTVAGLPVMRAHGRATGDPSEPILRLSSHLVQGATAAVTLAAAVHWPAFFAVVIPLLGLSRFYYRERFNVEYPGPAKTAS